TSTGRPWSWPTTGARAAGPTATWSGCPRKWPPRSSSAPSGSPSCPPPNPPPPRPPTAPTAPGPTPGAASSPGAPATGPARPTPQPLPHPATYGADCPWAYLRGVFLARGSVNRPGRPYHLELVCDSPAVHALVGQLLEECGLHAGSGRRRGSLLHYLKGADDVVAFLQVIGASRAVLELENSRALKGMRNRVNRIVNAETANLDKVVAASLRQIEAIHRLQARGQLSQLSPVQQALA